MEKCRDNPTVLQFSTAIETLQFTSEVQSKHRKLTSDIITIIVNFDNIGYF